MAKRYTDALIRKLNRQCFENCKKGLCRMECDVRGAKLGYCKRVWEMVTK